MAIPARPRASVYVDGFNLYRRVLEGHPEFKWLNLEALAERLLPEYDVIRVRYFTATIKALPGSDVDSPQRQQVYLRALATLPRTSIHLGIFRVDRRRMLLHPTRFDEHGEPVTVQVKKVEEKGSDVALASYLLLDAVRGDADVYVVLTNDSDLVTPLRLVKNELGAAIGLITPMAVKRSSNELKQTGPVFHRQVTHDVLAKSQFPDELRDDVGRFTRPRKWAGNSEGPAETGPSNR